MITFYPDHEFEGDRAVKTGDEPVNPMIAVEITDPDGTVLDRGYVALGGTEEIGKYTFGLTGYRRWSSFRITSDPGYLVVCFSLWLGLIGIMLRYSADIWVWLVCGTRED